MGPLLFLVYINDIKHAIECDNVKLFAVDIFLFKNDRNIYVVKEKASDLFETFLDVVLPSNYGKKTNFVLFHAKNKPIP